MAIEGHAALLTVETIRHPAFPEGEVLADRLFSLLCADPTAPGERSLGVRVRFRSGGTDAQPPEDVPLDGEGCRAIVVLIDDAMVADRAWWPTIRRLLMLPWSETRRVIPVAFTQHAPTLARGIATFSFPPAAEDDPELRSAILCRLVLYELCELLRRRRGASRLRVFISYARRDGTEIARGLDAYLDATAGIPCYRDVTDIPPGANLDEVIPEAVRDSAAVMVVHTDAYSSRPICRDEARQAKLWHLPMVVVSALQSGEDCSLPYLGNLPVVRWQADDSILYEQVLQALLVEALRAEFFHQRVNSVLDLHGTEFRGKTLIRPPEPLTPFHLRHAPDETATIPCLYPDPPVGDSQLRDANYTEPSWEYITLVVYLSRHLGVTTTADPLDQLVGISIGDSLDLAHRGLGEIHVRHALIETVRYLFEAGASVAYGGDLRKGGYADAIGQLARTHVREGRSGPERFHNFLAWPEWQRLSTHEEAQLTEAMTLVKLPRPSAAPAFLPREPSERSPFERLWYARSLRAMRQKMTRRISARIQLGGKVAAHNGFYPGIAEEAFLAIRTGVPLFVAGGFGGCAHAVAEALRGRRPKELTEAYQLARTPGFSVLLTEARAHGDSVDYDELAARLAEAGRQDRRNELSQDENERLTASEDTDEIIMLIIRGLRRLQPSAGNFAA